MSLAQRWQFLLRDARSIKHRLARRLAALGAGGIGLSGVLSFLALSIGGDSTALASAGMASLVAGLSALAAAGAARIIGVPKPGGRASIEDGRLVVPLGQGKQWEIGAEALETGYAMPPYYQGAPARVRLMTKDGDELLLVVDTFGEGLEMLRALGVDDRRVSVRARQHGGFLVSVFGALALTLPSACPLTIMIVGLDSPVPLLLAPMIWGLLTAWLVRRLSPGELDVGADGVSFGRGKRRRFVSFADIERVSASTESVVVTLAGQDDWVIPLGPVGANVVQRMARRIETLSERAGTGRGSESLDLLRQGDRSREEWVAALGALLDAEDYRSPTVPRARVLEVLEDDLADPDERLGAALALMERDPEATAPKVRVAVEKCANPELAEALEEVVRSAKKRRT